jgi:PAS domain S-box-containing protein
MSRPRPKRGDVDILLAVLIVEDSESDAQLIVRLLKKAGYELVYEQVETAKQMRLALEKHAWDIVISDYRLPQFDGRAALKLLQETGRDIPFIVVSGSIGEETAVAMMKAGAHDYLIKGDLARLVPAVERELNQAGIRRGRKQAEEALHASEARYRSVFDRMLDGIYLSTHAGKFVDVNPAMVKMFGYSSKEEMLEMDIKTELYFDPEERGTHLLDTGQGETDIYRLRRKDGSEIWVEDRGTYTYNEQGGIVFHEGMMRDVTERVQAQKALAVSEAELRALFASMQDVVLVIDRQGVYCKIAPTKPGLLVKPPVELLGKNLRDVFPAEQAEIFIGTLQQVLDTKQTTQIEYELLIGDRTVWFETSISPMDKDSTLWVARDVSGRRQAEEKIRESEDRYRALVEQIPAITYIDKADGSGSSLFVSPQIESILGVSQEEWMLGDVAFWATLIHPDDRERVLVAYQHITDTGQAFNEEYRMVARNGRMVWIDDHAALLKGTTRQPDSVQGVMFDITERVQAEEALRKSESNLKKAQHFAHTGSWMWNIKTNELEWSDEMYHIFGVNKETFSGVLSDVVSQSIHPDDRYKVEQSNLSVINEAKPISLEYRVVWPDGSEHVVWAEAGELILDGTGHPSVLSGTVQDITLRKQAEQDIRQRVTELELLYESGLALSQLLNPKEIGQKILELMEEKLGWHHTRIRLYHPEDDSLELLDFNQPGLKDEVERRKAAERYQTLISHSSQGMSGWVIKHGKPVRVGDVSNDPHYIEAYPGIRSGLYVPMQLGERTIGVISIESEQPDAFSETDERLVTTLANQAASAFENARLFESTQRRVSELTALHRASQTLLAARLDPEHIYDAVHQAVAQTMPCEAFVIVLDDEDGGDYHAVYFFDKGERFAPRRLPRGAGLSGHVISLGKSLLVHDLQTENDLPMTHFGSQEVVRSVLAVPLRRGDEVIGMLSTQSYQPHAFGEAQCVLLETISAQLASAIDNARLYQQTQSRLKELQALHKVSVSLRTAQTLEEALPILLDETLAALETDSGSILLYHPDSDDLQRTFARGWFIDLQNIPIKPGEGVAGTVLATGKIYFSQEFVRDALPHAATRDKIPAGWGGACLPIRAGSESVGVLFVSVRLPRQITSGQMKLLNSLAEIAGATLHRMRLHDETARRAEEFASLYKTSKTLSTENELASLLQSIVEHAKTLLHAASSGVYLFDKERLRLGEGMAGLVAQNRQPLRIADYSTWEGRSQKYASIPFRAVLEVPMLYGGELIGVLTADETGDSERKFTEADERLLSLFASQAAGAIHSARLLEETVHRLERLQALRVVDQAISSSLDMRLTLSILLTHTLPQLNVDAADVLLLHSDSNLLELMAGRGFHTLLLESLSLSDSLAGRAIMEHRTVTVFDLETAALGENQQFEKFWKEENFSACWCVPLIVKGEARGVLEVYRRTASAPDSEWLEFLETLASQAAIAIENAQLFENLQREGWSRAMELRDEETEGHTQRVADLTVTIAKAMDLPGQEMPHIRRGALLHDIGKMGIPDQILLKPDKLTDEEWVIMRTHPQLARDLLMPIVYLREALVIPYCHHENWDGTGYPQGLKGQQIPLAARLFAIVDVWDALTSNRPYRKKWTKKKTLAYIQEQRGKRFDPQVVDAFEKIVK